MIAICIPVLNLIDYTRYCVESILRHSTKWDIKLFLLDNGSTDPRVLQYMKSLAPEISVVTRNEQNRWVYGAWNQNGELALRENPELVCFMSNDVQVGRDWLDPIMREYRRDQLNGQKRYFLMNGQFHDHANFDLEVERAISKWNAVPREERTAPGRCGWCFFVTPVAMRLFLPIPETLKLWYGDDWVHLKLREAGYKCVTVLDSCAIHFGSKTLEVMDPMERNRMIAADKVEYERLTGEKM